MPNSKYVILYDWICEQYTGLAREVFALIYGLCQESGSCNISNSYICKRLCASKRGVQKALHELQVVGAIEYKPQSICGKAAIINLLNKGEQNAPKKGEQNAPKKGEQNAPLIPNKGEQNAPKKGEQNAPLNINNNINNSLVSLVNPTQPNPVFNDFAKFEQYINAQTDVPSQIRTKYIDYHRQRTFWRRMTQEEALENLRKWVETEYPARKHKTIISKSYEEYYETFGTTEVLSGWQIIKDENEQIRYVKRN